MKHLFLLLALGLSLLACSTASHYRRYERKHPDLVARTKMERDARATYLDARLLDSVHPRRAKMLPVPDSLVVHSRPNWLARVFKHVPQATTYTATQLPASIGKKSTVQVYYGPATVTNAGKKATVAAGDGASVVQKAGPVVQADSGAQVKLAIAPRGQAAAGEDISQAMPPPPPAKDLLATLWDSFKPALLIGGAGLGLAAIGAVLTMTPAGPWLLALVRRRKNDDSLPA